MIRLFAYLLLALMLPIQGYAAACAQICAIAAHEPAAVDHGVMDHGDMDHGDMDHGDGDHHAMAHDGAHPGSTPAHEDCGESALGAGKCCQAHAYASAQALEVKSAEPESFAHAPVAARWTSFIPEEPSPPPIGAPRRA